MFDVDDEGFSIQQKDVLEPVPNDDMVLYEKLNIALHKIDDCFKVVFADVDKNDGIEYGITAPIQTGLPESVGRLFFDVNHNYKVSVSTTSRPFLYDQKYYHVNLKKCC